MPLTFQFAPDPGVSNSDLPLLVYQGAFPADAATIERRFAANDWRPAWRSGVHPFHHSHANTHEALGVASGWATVLFGGYDGTSTPRSDTWEWNGTVWNPRVTLVKPAGRWGHGLAFDSKRGKAVLFGGFDGSAMRNDTWEWDGTSWQQRSVATPPPARGFAGMA